MKKILLTSAVLACAGLINQASAQAWSQNFNAGIPGTWVQINVDGKTPDANLGTAIVNALGPVGGKAWMTRLRTAGDSCITSTSWFAPVGKADRWIITPSFSVTSSNMFLTWEDYAQDAQYTDSLQILVSPTAGTTTGAFTATIWNQKGATTGFVQHGVSLGAYNGQTIRLAFRNNSYDKFLLNIDNVAAEVLPAADMKMVSVAPVAGSPVAYGTVGSSQTISGVVKNQGATAVTSYTVKYQQGANAPVSQVISANIAPYGTGSFTFSTPYSISALGALPIKVWVEVGSDANHANDTLSTQFTGVSFMPSKKLTFEEATGTWCGWCVRGIVFMDSMLKMHPGATTQIAVHNADPMVITAYDNLITSTSGFTGFPGVIVDRREVIDPSDMFDAYNAEKDYFGFADITMSAATITGNNLSLPVTVKPAVDLSGDYRLALVITEDDVHNASGGQWDQHNYYSSQSQNIALWGNGINYQTLPATIPSSQMYYDFVARAAVPGPGGASGSLPASMTHGTNYNYTFTTTLDASWNKAKLNFNVLLIRNSDGQVLNSANKLHVGISNIKAGVNDITIYPNPAKDAAHVKFTLTNATHANIQVMDATGRVVSTIADQNLAAGEHTVDISTANLANGLYNVLITTDNGSVTERLSVVK